MPVAQLHIVADLLLEVVYQVGAGRDLATVGATELAEGISDLLLPGLLRPAAGEFLKGSDGLWNATRASVGHSPAVEDVRVFWGIVFGLVQCGQGGVVLFQGQVAGSQVLESLPAILRLLDHFQKALQGSNRLLPAFVTHGRQAVQPRDHGVRRPIETGRRGRFSFAFSPTFGHG